MPDDHLVAARVASGTGKLLVSLRMAMAGATERELRAAGDRRAHEHIVGELGRLCPSDIVLSEEAADDPDRLGAERVWLVDPLDGTREFGEGRSDWAVHVALVEGGELAAGAVALPDLDITLATRPAPVLTPACASPPRIVASRTRAPALVERLRAALGAVVLPMGSAGAKAMAVVMGQADVYIHAGGQYEWDSAAPVAVAGAAGLHVSRLDGSPLRYNQPNPWLPDLVVCRSELAATVLGVLNGGVGSG